MAKVARIVSISAINGATSASMKRNKRIDPPFGYFGSKNRLAAKLCANLPKHSAWVEVFCGSAALTLRKEPAPIEIINDIDGEIVNLFQQLREHPRKLIKLVALTPYSRQELENARIPAKGLTKLERARRFLITAMLAINGTFGNEKGGFSFTDSYARHLMEARVSRWYHLPERISAVVERLRRIRVEHMDGLKLFRSFLDRPASLVYLDPPYLGERVNGYNHDIKTEDFHRNLLAMADKAQCMVFISSYENPLYMELLSDWVSNKIETTTRDASGRSHQRTEVVWMNRHYVKAVESRRLPIHLDPFERKNGKINPTRKRR